MPARPIVVNRSFPTAYDVRVLHDAPARSGPTYEFNRDDRLSLGGVYVGVTADNAWTGLVSNGPPSVAPARSGLYATPSPSMLCVVARGDAYLIDVTKPQAWSVVPRSPVIDVRPIVDRRLLIFATPWELVALGEHGLAWQTPRIAVDGLRLEDDDGNELRGVSDPADEDEAAPFRVDLATGAVYGGRPLVK